MATLPEHLKASPVGKERLDKAVLESYQRDRVLGAASEVFAKHGYLATTVDDLVAGAQIGVGSFYALFGGKEECFLALFDQILVEAKTRIGAAITADSSWAERILSGLHEILEELKPFLEGWSPYGPDGWR